MSWYWDDGVSHTICKLLWPWPLSLYNLWHHRLKLFMLRARTWGNALVHISELLASLRSRLALRSFTVTYVHVFRKQVASMEISTITPSWVDGQKNCGTSSKIYETATISDGAEGLKTSVNQKLRCTAFDVYYRKKLTPESGHFLKKMNRFKDLVLHCWRSFREILIRTCFKWSNIQFKSRTIRNGALNISSVGKRRNRIWTSVWDLSVLVYVTADELFTCQSLTRSIFHPKMIIQATDIWNWKREHRTNVHFRVGKIFNIDISTELVKVTCFQGNWDRWPVTRVEIVLKLKIRISDISTTIFLNRITLTVCERWQYNWMRYSINVDILSLSMNLTWVALCKPCLVFNTGISLILSFVWQKLGSSIFIIMGGLCKLTLNE